MGFLAFENHVICLVQSNINWNFFWKYSVVSSCFGLRPPIPTLPVVGRGPLDQLSRCHLCLCKPRTRVTTPLSTSRRWRGGAWKVRSELHFGFDAKTKIAKKEIREISETNSTEVDLFCFSVNSEEEAALILQEISETNRRYLWPGISQYTI